MAGSVEGTGFWLPSEFFDDFVTTDKENLDKNRAANSDSEFCFPTEFPYDFEIKTGQNINEKWRVMSTSPQSTLSHLWSFEARSAGGSSNGNPNGVTSPPARAQNVGGDVPGPAKHPVLHKSLEQLRPSVFRTIYQHKQCSEPRMYQGWSVQQNPTHIGRSGSRGLLSGGAAMKRECAGTGVFLPRRYDGNISNDCANVYSLDSRKKPGHSSAPYIPERNVYELNNNFDRINGYVPPQPQFQPKFNPGFVSEYDLSMAQKNALIVQHRRSLLLEKSSPVSRGMCLPQEWTY